MGGQVRTVAGGDAYDGLYFGYFTVTSQNWTGADLELTIRLIHMDGPNGTIIYDPDGFEGNEVVGPGAGSSGDYDGDGDVDADDVDELCENIGTSDPILLSKMDLDDDGDVDADDQLIHVTTLLEYDLDGDEVPDGQGTFRADFNTDGTVDLADLTILRTNSGLTGQGFADGDTNCDGTVDLADLTTLRGLSGSSVSGVPEPALTILLLAAGGVLAGKRRR